MAISIKIQMQAERERVISLEPNVQPHLQQKQRKISWVNDSGNTCW